MGEAAAYAALSQIALIDRPLDQTLEEVTFLAKWALTQTQAFAALLRLSQQQGVRLQQAAQALVDRTA
jgi:hypothetical protein